jgi:hypothetical protein
MAQIERINWSELKYVIHEKRQEYLWGNHISALLKTNLELKTQKIIHVYHRHKNNNIH